MAVRELLLGLTIGFSAGISPGPLQTLVFVTTMQRGFRSGAKVAASPLVTDGPIILLTLALVSALPSRAETALMAGGALFIAYLGVQTIRGASTAEMVHGDANTAQRDFLHGVVVNAMSPSPWLFWIGAGAPLLIDAWRRSPLHAAAFIGGFYMMLIGGKLAVALLAAAGRSRVSLRVFRRALLVAGMLLLVDAALLARTALT